MYDMITLLNIMFIRVFKKLSPYRKENTMRLHYKDQLVNAV
jgi:hypothetical protein